MKLLVTGVSHKTAPVEIRERLAVSEGYFAPSGYHYSDNAGDCAVEHPEAIDDIASRT